MRCYGRCPPGSGARRRGTPSASPPRTPPVSGAATATASATEDGCEDDEGDPARRRRRDDSPVSSGGNTIDLTRAYSLAVDTDSYNEVRIKIFGGSDEEVSSSSLIASILQPDRASIQDALRAARSSRLTTLASSYFDSSDLTADFCLSLHRAVDGSRALYAPLLDILSNPVPLTPDQCDRAFDILTDFHSHDNPFPGPDAFDAFRDLRDCYPDLCRQLDHRFLRTHRRHRLLLFTTSVSAFAYAVIAGPALFLRLPPAPRRGLLDGLRRPLQERMTRLEAAARGAFVLNSELDTFEQLVSWLQAAVESDRALVQRGLERGRGRGQCHFIEEVLRHLRSNRPTFDDQLIDLDKHVCICLAALNRARSRLLNCIRHSAIHVSPHEQHHDQEHADTTT